MKECSIDDTKTNTEVSSGVRGGRRLIRKSRRDWCSRSKVVIGLSADHGLIFY
ncbi:MAG TPA: hypothetical protein PKJ80_06935 [Candidatus Saccharicenans sp.]|nr:hypothetical protein [Candidatus Saccharicenans sp.]